VTAITGAGTMILLTRIDDINADNRKNIMNEVD